MDRTMAAACGIIIVSIAAILILTPATLGAGTGTKLPVTASPATGQATPVPADGTIQTITLGFRNGVYAPAEIRVKQGTRVRIEADPATLTGCMSTVNIDGYGISKHIQAGDNLIEFTADKAGTFPIHCSMGMGGGQLVVEDSSGSVPVPSQTPAVANGGGGCGCSG